MDETTSYILLGEGDYTYSLDACRYLSSMDDDTKEDDSEKNNNVHHHHHHRITCTGIDTLHELQTKYHNVNFVLNKLFLYNNSSNSSNRSSSNNVVVTASIIHGVNAVSIVECNNINNTTTNSSNNSYYSSSGYDHVIFNHPHIGTENATLHSQFLAHLFHACNKTWMKKSTTSSTTSRGSSGRGALLHITLVIGQCERWNCIMYATKHELILLRRGKFITPLPPPLPPPRAAAAAAGTDNDYSCNGTSKRKNGNNNNNNNNTYYNLRRHQSGRSFANRRSSSSSSVVNSGNNRGGGSGDSETLVFGRVCDYQHFSHDDDNNKYNTSQFLLPWECNASSKHLDRKSNKHNTSSNNNNNNNTDNDSTLLFTCKHCNNKSFREYRSLRNHLLSLHPTSSEAMHSLMDTTNETNKKKKKKKMNYLNDKKRKLLTTSDNKYDEDNDKCQKMMQQQQQHESLHHCNDTVLNCPTIIYTCSLCDDTGRIFPNKDALLSHQRATHFGNHKDIKPDWYRREDDHELRNNDKEAGNDFAKSQVLSCEMQCCQICDRQYVTGMDDVIHALEFLPSSSAIAKAIMMERSKNVNNVNNNNDISVVIHPTSPVQYRCIFCSKSFNQIRAQRQHENFCSSQQQQSEQSTNT